GAAGWSRGGRAVGRRGGAGSSACGRSRCRRPWCLGFAKALLGLELGLTLGILFLAMALFLRPATCFRGFAFGLLDRLAAGAPLGFFLGVPTLFLFAKSSVRKRTDARGTLVLGQVPQHHARTAAGLGGRWTGRT